MPCYSISNVYSYLHGFQSRQLCLSALCHTWNIASSEKPCVVLVRLIVSDQFRNYLSKLFLQRTLVLQQEDTRVSSKFLFALLEGLRGEEVYFWDSISSQTEGVSNRPVYSAWPLTFEYGIQYSSVPIQLRMQFHHRDIQEFLNVSYSQTLSTARLIWKLTHWKCTSYTTQLLKEKPRNIRRCPVYIRHQSDTKDECAYINIKGIMKPNLSVLNNCVKWKKMATWLPHLLQVLPSDIEK